MEGQLVVVACIDGYRHDTLAKRLLVDCVCYSRTNGIYLRYISIGAHELACILVHLVRCRCSLVDDYTTLVGVCSVTQSEVVYMSAGIAYCLCL